MASTPTPAEDGPAARQSMPATPSEADLDSRKTSLGVPPPQWSGPFLRRDSSRFVNKARHSAHASGAFSSAAEFEEYGAPPIYADVGMADSFGEDVVRAPSADLTSVQSDFKAALALIQKVAARVGIGQMPEYDATAAVDQALARINTVHSFDDVPAAASTDGRPPQPPRSPKTPVRTPSLPPSLPLTPDGGSRALSLPGSVHSGVGRAPVTPAAAAASGSGGFPPISANSFSAPAAAAPAAAASAPPRRTSGSQPPSPNTASGQRAASLGLPSREASGSLEHASDASFHPLSRAMSLASLRSGGAGGSAALSRKHSSFAGLTVANSFRERRPEELDPFEKERLDRLNAKPVDPSTIGYSDEHNVVRVLDALYIASFTTQLLVASAYLRGHEPENRVVFPLVSAACAVYNLLWCGSRLFVQDRQGFEMVYLRRHIKPLYLGTWAPFDLFFAIPIEFIFAGWSWTAMYAIQLRQLLRLARIISLATSRNPLVGPRPVVYFSGLASLLFISVHTMVILFSYLTALPYAHSMYWTMTTVTSVGYGDVLIKLAEDGVALTTDVRIFAGFVSLAGVFLVATVTAVTTYFFTNTDAVVQATNERKLLLGAMMAHHRIPWSVQVEVMTLFPAALDSLNEERFTQLIAAFPDYMLANIDRYIRAKTLTESLPVFEELSTDELAALSASLRRHVAMPGDCLMVAGIPGEEMFFLVRGAVEVTVPVPQAQPSPAAGRAIHGREVHLMDLGAGSYFGERALTQENCLRRATATALITTELFVLHRSSYRELCEAHEGVKEVFDELFDAAAEEGAKGHDAKS